MNTTRLTTANITNNGPDCDECEQSSFLVTARDQGLPAQNQASF